MYRFYDKDDVLLYVGITDDAVRRYRSHALDKAWFSRAVRSTMEHFETRGALVEAEVRAIQTEHPKYNQAHTVVPLPDKIGANGRRRQTYRSDASRFPKPDDIARDDKTTDEERERRLDQLEAVVRTTLANIHCWICGGRSLQAPDRYRCINCGYSWTQDEFIEHHSPIGGSR